MEEILYLVSPQGDLPKPKKIIKAKDMFDDKVANFKVKSITDLEWNKSGDLICTLKGDYI